MKRLALVGLVVVLAGCGGDDAEGSDQISGGEVDVASANASNYDVAYDICDSLTPEELAAENNAASTDPEVIATAYASAYRQDLRQANHDGCLDALLGKPKSPP